MSVFRYILRCLSYWSPWCIWNITGREHNHYRSMCDKREIKKEVLHYVSKSPCLSSDRPCCDRHCRMLDFVKTVWCSGTSNSSFLRLSPLVIIRRAHFYTGTPRMCALWDRTVRTPECPDCFASLCSEQGAALPCAALQLFLLTLTVLRRACCKIRP